MLQAQKEVLSKKKKTIIEPTRNIEMETRAPRIVRTRIRVNEI